MMLTMRRLAWASEVAAETAICMVVPKQRRPALRCQVHRAFR